MVGDLRQFEALLKSRRHPDLHVQSKVLADENHLSVVPVIMTRGLKWALPGATVVVSVRGEKNQRALGIKTITRTKASASIIDPPVNTAEI